MTISEISAVQRLSGYYAQCGVMFVTWPDGIKTQGTCSVVGLNDILTAGHMVYNPDHGGWASDFSFYFGADYNNLTDSFDSYNYTLSLTSGSYKWSATAWPDQLYTDLDNTTVTSQESQYDIALIGVSKPIGDVLGWLGLNWGADFTQSVLQVGYPSDGTGMMASTIIVTKNPIYEIYESSQDIMGPGSSGGPIITPDGYIIGIKSSGSSTGATWADIGLLKNYLIQHIEGNNELLGTIAPSYTISSNSTSVNEGSTAIFTITTINVAAGTLIKYTISGVSSTDLQSTPLTGSVTISATGTATISIPIAADGVTEGAETLTLTAQGKTASVVINDTSTTANAVQVYDTDLSGRYLSNGAKRFVGTSGNDTINGTAGGDLIYGDDGDDKLYGLGGNDLISGLNGDDYLSGGDGDDTLFGSKGDDQIYGGKGVDIATYDGDYQNFIITALYNSKNAVSGYKVIDKTGKEGTDTISTDVEFLNFHYGNTIVTLNNGTITAKTTNNAPTGTVTISGTARQNESLTVSNSISDVDGVGAITYMWLVSKDNKTWTNLSSGPTLKLTESEVGKYLYAYASYIDGKGNAETVSSYATTSVVNVNDAPVGSVSISGTPTAGQVLTASNNLSDLDGLGVITYLWQSSSDGFTWTNLSTGSSLTISNTLVGKYIRANATYTDGHGTSESVTSIKTEAVKPLSQQTTTESHNLSVIVDKGILGRDAVLLKGLLESITLMDGLISQHTVQYSGISFDYDQIDALLTTVTRDGEFTAEFTKEINDYLKTEANITYKVAIGLVGAANIDAILLTVAGADGSYVS